MFAIKDKEIETNLPRFIDHKSARKWFKDRYAEKFVMVDTDVVGDVKYYYYHLVMDREAYLNRRQGYVSFEISERGHIHVVV